MGKVVQSNETTGAIEVWDAATPSWVDGGFVRSDLSSGMTERWDGSAATPSWTPTNAMVSPNLLSSGRYFACIGQEGGWNTDTAGSSLGAAQDKLAAYPFWGWDGTDVDRVSFNITTAGDGSCVARTGLYEDDGTGTHPGVLVTDFGTTDITTTGLKEVTINETITGLMWIVWVIQGGTSVNPVFRTAGMFSNFQRLAAAPSSNNWDSHQCIRQSADPAFGGALPDPLSPRLGTGTIRAPLLLLRAA